MVYWDYIGWSIVFIWLLCCRSCKDCIDSMSRVQSMQDRQQSQRPESQRTKLLLLQKTKSPFFLSLICCSLIFLLCSCFHVFLEEENIEARIIVIFPQVEWCSSMNLENGNYCFLIRICLNNRQSAILLQAWGQSTLIRASPRPNRGRYKRTSFHETLTHHSTFHDLRLPWGTYKQSWQKNLIHRLRTRIFYYRYEKFLLAWD